LDFLLIQNVSAGTFAPSREADPGSIEFSIAHPCLGSFTISSEINTEPAEEETHHFYDDLLFKNPKVLCADCPAALAASACR
jgi:hypothetical protein